MSGAVVTTEVNLARSCGSAQEYPRSALARIPSEQQPAPPRGPTGLFGKGSEERRKERKKATGNAEEQKSEKVNKIRKWEYPSNLLYWERPDKPTTD